MTLTKNDFGSYVHTALRKCCDSTVTSLAYNLIHVSKGGWSLFLYAVYSHVNMESKEKLIESFTERIKDIKLVGFPHQDDFEDYPDGILSKDMNEFFCIVLAFSLFERHDTLGALAFLLEEFKEDK